MGQQIFAVDSRGGFLSNDELSRMVRHLSQPLIKFRQFVDIEPAAGKSRGNKVLFNKISNISTAGGTLVETNTIPKRQYTITQGTLTITELIYQLCLNCANCWKAFRATITKVLKYRGLGNQQERIQVCW